MALEWSDELSSGIKEIDDQHKELFKRVNELLDAMDKGHGKEEVGKIVKFLEDYVVTHFGTEEKYMSKYSYPDYNSHKALHTAFISDFSALKKEFAEHGATTRLVILINRKVCDWLTNHISKIDKLLGAYLKTKALT